MALLLHIIGQPKHGFICVEILSQLHEKAKIYYVLTPCRKRIYMHTVLCAVINVTFDHVMSLIS